jgi:hypothetical protein
MKRRAAAKRTAGAAGGAGGEPKVPKTRRIVVRDLSVYARNLKIPAAMAGLGSGPLKKTEVSADFRRIAGLPLLSDVSVWSGVE